MAGGRSSEQPVGYARPARSTATLGPARAIRRAPARGRTRSRAGDRTPAPRAHRCRQHSAAVRRRRPARGPGDAHRHRRPRRHLLTRIKPRDRACAMVVSPLADGPPRREDSSHVGEQRRSPRPRWDRPPHDTWALETSPPLARRLRGAVTTPAADRRPACARSTRCARPRSPQRTPRRRPNARPRDTATRAPLGAAM
jgi:hypothetical protein